MQIARMTATQNRRLIVYNHSQNDSYDRPEQRETYVAKKVPIDTFLEAKWPKSPEFQVIDYLKKNFAAFLEIAMQIKYNALVLDDAGMAFHANCTELEVDFMGTPKNNKNDIFYQMHHFNQAPPKLLLAMDMMVLKETEDNLPLPGKVPYRHIITQLQREIRSENDLMPMNKRWCERIVDLKNGIIYQPDTSGKIISVKRFRDYL